MNHMFENRAILNLFTQKLNQNEIFSLSKWAAGDYALSVAATSAASREKLNILQANTSTPLNRAFFVRSLRTPKENALSVVLSMVGRKGQRSIVGCFPVMAVFSPLYALPPAVRSRAGSLINQLQETAMIYKFLCLNRTKPTYNQEAIYLEAESEEAARFQLSADYRLLLSRPIGRFAKSRAKHPPLQLADCPPNLTACSCGDMTTTQSKPMLTEVEPVANFVTSSKNCTKQHAFLYETTINPINVGNSSQSEWENIGKNPIDVQKTILQTLAVISYPFGVVAKSTTSRRKLNDKTLANDSTPLNRAFFVRGLRTPKINLAIDLFSMVGRKGQRLGVGCVPKFAVFLPLYALPPTVGKLAVVFKSNFGAITMLFKFLVLGEKRLTISIRAKSEAEARQKIQFTSPALCVARYPANFGMKGGAYA